MHLSKSYYPFLVSFLFSFERHSYKEKEREIDLPSSGSLPKWPQGPELVGSEAGI